LGKYRQQRNNVIHHESFQENDLRKLELFYFLLGKTPKNDAQDLKNLTYQAKILSRNYVNQKKIEFNQFNCVVFNELLELFNDLESKYLELERELNNKNGQTDF
jgi:hypothetical protein